MHTVLTTTDNEGNTHAIGAQMEIGEHESVSRPVEDSQPQLATSMAAWAQGATGVVCKGMRFE